MTVSLATAQPCYAAPSPLVACLSGYSRLACPWKIHSPCPGLGPGAGATCWGRISPAGICRPAGGAPWISPLSSSQPLAGGRPGPPPGDPRSMSRNRNHTTDLDAVLTVAAVESTLICTRRTTDGRPSSGPRPGRLNMILTRHLCRGETTGGSICKPSLTSRLPSPPLQISRMRLPSTWRKVRQDLSTIGTSSTPCMVLYRYWV